jgi:colanic acid/amylovoran biosynthesis glycosyltransferase
MKDNLKVAYILHRFPHLSETFIMREMNWLLRHNVDVKIFSLLPPKHKTVHEGAKRLLTYSHYSPLFSVSIVRALLFFLFTRPINLFKALFRLVQQTFREPKLMAVMLALFPKIVYFARQLQALGIDHIHAHFVWMEGLAAGVVKDLLEITFTINPHAFGLFSRNQRDVRAELENASKIITISNYNRRHIANLSPVIEERDIEIVYCGIEMDTMRPPTQRPQNNAARIVSIGRMIEKKGFEYLVEACAILAGRGVDFVCRIVGQGPLKELLQSRIEEYGLQEQVILVGILEQSDVVKLYQDSDLFSLACVVAEDGDRDGIPVVLMEAMACGLPVVSTVTSGIPDLIVDEENGFLIPARDAKAFADALEKLISDANLRLELGMNARQTIQDKFQLDHNAAKLLDIFRRVSGYEHRVAEQPAAQVAAQI